jgi:hypothetical protein
MPSTAWDGPSAIRCCPPPSDYLRQPGILTLGSGEIDAEEAWLAIEPALKDALAALATMRETEGSITSSRTSSPASPPGFRRRKNRRGARAGRSASANCWPNACATPGSTSIPPTSAWPSELALFADRSLDRGLGGGEAGDGHAVGRAGHVVQAELVAELHRVRIAAVLAADAELDVGTGAAALGDGDLP